MSEYDSEVDIGKLGETKLTEWCATIGLTSNRSLEEDKMGWDHLIEFPYEKSTLPKDKQPKPIECKIQVKSTFRKDKGVRIKLSSLKRLVDYTYPAFILFYEYSNKLDPELISSYLVHIDKEKISRILREIRKNELSHTPKPLNQVEIKISYSKKYKLHENSGLALRNKISSFILNGIVAYQHEKHKITEVVGYENNGYRLQFNTDTNNFKEHLINSAMGYESFVEVRTVKIYDNRFNFNDIIEINTSDKATITIQPQIVNKCKLHFKTNSHSPRLTFEAEVIQIPDLATMKSIVFFRAKLFSIELKQFNDIIDYKFHITIDKQVEIHEIIKFLKLIGHENINKQLILQIEIEQDEEELTWSMELNHALPDTSQLVRALDILRGKFELDYKLLTSFGEIYNQSNKIIALSRVMSNSMEEIQFDIEPISEHEANSRPLQCDTSLSLLVSIGSNTLGAISIIHGELNSDDMYQARNSTILDTLFFDREIPDLNFLKELESKALNKYTDGSSS